MRLLVPLAALTLLVAGCTPDRPPRADIPLSPTPSASGLEPIRTTADCRVLCISDAVVTQGQVVEVTFAPPSKHIWGISGEIWAMWPRPRRVAHFSGGPDKSKLDTAWPCRNCGFIDIGYYGNATWSWRVPDRLEPGVYELRKDATGPGIAPFEERQRWYRVTFDVVAPSAAAFEGEWVLLDGTGPRGDIPLVQGSPITLTVRGERVGGIAACNSYGGPMTIAGTRVDVGDIAQTLMGCPPGITRSEQRFLAALESVDHIAFTGDQLQLTGPETELTFERRPPSDG